MNLHKNNTNSALLGIVILVGCLMGVASDIYAPSLPAIAHDLKAPINDVQWTMGIFMIGVSLSQLFYGPVSEGVGRKFPLLVGLVILLIGSITCLYASTIETLLAGRFIQGIGAGAGASLWRSIFRDSFQGDQLAKYGSYLSIFMVFIVPVSPTLGGYLEEWFGWRSCFYFLMGYSLLSLGAVLVFFKESNKHLHKERLRMIFFKDAVGQLLNSRVFMGYSFCVFLCYGAIFSWFTIGPVLLIEGCGISPVEFGWICSLGGGLSMALGGIINGKFVTRYGTNFMLRFGWSLMTLSGIAMMTFSLIYGMNTFIVSAPFILFIFGSTFIWTNAFAGAFTPFGNIAGYAGAMYSFIQIGGAAILGSIAAFLPDENQMPLAIIFMFCPALAWLLFEIVVVGRGKNS